MIQRYFSNVFWTKCKKELPTRLSPQTSIKKLNFFSLSNCSCEYCYLLRPLNPSIKYWRRLFKDSLSADKVFKCAFSTFWALYCLDQSILSVWINACLVLGISYVTVPSAPLHCRSAVCCRSETLHASNKRLGVLCLSRLFLPSLPTYFGDTNLDGGNAILIRAECRLFSFSFGSALLIVSNESDFFSQTSNKSRGFAGGPTRRCVGRNEKAWCCASLNDVTLCKILATATLHVSYNIIFTLLNNWLLFEVELYFCVSSGVGNGTA